MLWNRWTGYRSPSALALPLILAAVVQGTATARRAFSYVARPALESPYCVRCHAVYCWPSCCAICTSPTQHTVLPALWTTSPRTCNTTSCPLSPAGVQSPAEQPVCRLEPLRQRQRLLGPNAPSQPAACACGLNGWPTAPLTTLDHQRCLCLYRFSGTGQAASIQQVVVCTPPW